MKRLNNIGMTLIETLVALVIAMMILGILTAGILTASNWNVISEETKSDEQKIADCVDGKNDTEVEKKDKQIEGLALSDGENTLSIGTGDGIDSLTRRNDYGYHDLQLSKMTTTVLPVAKSTDQSVIDGQMEEELSKDTSYANERKQVMTFLEALEQFKKTPKGVKALADGTAAFNKELLKYLQENGVSNKMDITFMKEHLIFTNQSQQLIYRALILDGKVIPFATGGNWKETGMSMIYNTAENMWYMAPRQAPNNPKANTALKFQDNVVIQDDGDSVSVISYTLEYLQEKKELFHDGYLHVGANNLFTTATSSVTTEADLLTHIKSETSGWVVISDME